MRRPIVFRAHACALVLALAALVAGCASGGGGAAAPTVFLAPDGAKATPNTGASRLADGGMFLDETAAQNAATAPAATVADGALFTWTGGGQAVSVAGEFNAWDQAADPLVKQPDGSFRLVKRLTPGRYAYKFVVDGQWQPDPSAKETADDGFGAKNSIIVVGEGATSVTPPSWTSEGRAAAAGAGAAAGAVTSADGTVFTWTGGGAAVSLAGEFNAWDQAADPLVKQADGSFRIVKKLAPGRYPYKFVVDGQWKPDPAAKETVDDGFGGTNSVAVVGDGAAAPAAVAAGTAGAVAAPAAGGAGKAPQITPEGVRFTFGGAARSVHLAGDFNAWSVNADPLTRGADGAWTIVKSLPPGTHAYKFVVDGTTWKTDDANPNTIDDGFGGKNAVVTVP